MSGEPWFKPKRYGYGGRPANWKGWLFLAVMVAVLPAMSYALPRHRADYWIGLAVWLVVLVGVATAKSSGPWRWRWGNRE